MVFPAIQYFKVCVVVEVPTKEVYNSSKQFVLKAGQHTLFSYRVLFVFSLTRFNDF